MKKIQAVFSTGRGDKPMSPLMVAGEQAKLIESLRLAVAQEHPVVSYEMTPDESGLEPAVVAESFLVEEEDIPVLRDALYILWEAYYTLSKTKTGLTEQQKIEWGRVAEMRVVLDVMVNRQQQAEEQEAPA